MGKKERGDRRVLLWHLVSKVKHLTGEGIERACMGRAQGMLIGTRGVQEIGQSDKNEHGSSFGMMLEQWWMRKVANNNR